MVIGVCTMELFIAEAESLKDKRRILKSLLDRVRGRFNVSIAEVDRQDLWQRATIAFACVTNERPQSDRILHTVVRFIETQADAQVTDYEIETY